MRSRVAVPLFLAALCGVVLAAGGGQWLASLASGRFNHPELFKEYEPDPEMVKWLTTLQPVSGAGAPTQPFTEAPVASPAPFERSPRTVLQTGHGAAITCLAYSANGRWLASGDDSGVIKVWNERDGTLRATLLQHTVAITRLSFPGRAPVLVSEDQGSVQHAWNVSTGKTLAVPQSAAPLTPFSGYVTADSPDGKLAAQGRGDEAILLTDRKSGRLLQTLRGQMREIQGLCFSPDGRMLAAGCGNGSDLGEISLWRRPETGRGPFRLGFRRPLRWGPVRTVAVSPDGKTVVSAGDDATLRWWDAPSSRLRRTRPGECWHPGRLTFSPDGRTLTIPRFGSPYRGEGSTLEFWDVPTGRLRKCLRSARPVAGALDTRRATLVNNRDSVEVWDLPSQTPLLHNSADGLTVLSPDGRHLAMGGFQSGGAATNEIVLYDLQTGEAVVKAASDSPVVGLEFSADSGTLVVAPADGSLEIRDGHTARLRRRLQMPIYLGNIACAPDGSQVAVLGQGGLFLWDTRTGAMLRRFPTIAPGVDFRLSTAGSLAYSPDGTRIAVADADRSIRLLDLRTGTLLHTLRGHQGTISSVAFAPDGRTLASVGGDGTVRLWDTGSGQQKRVLVRTPDGEDGMPPRVASRPHGH